MSETETQTTETSQTGTDPTQTGQGQATDQTATSAPVEPGKTADTKPERAAPEQYEFKAPEGREFDPEVMREFGEVARELGMPQDEAQKVLDKMSPVLEARQAKVMEEAVAEWVESAKADKEFGGDRLDENLGVAKTFLAEFGTPEMTKLLNDTGMGSHPEVIRLFYRAGKAMGPDKVLTGKAPAPSQGDARRLYSVSNMNP